MTACASTVCIYPSAIARACAALDESPVFQDLPDGYMRVLLRIIKKINLKRLNSPIVASRGKIAAESGKSVETVGRVIKWLEDRGLVRRSQIARPGLRGSSSPLIPTKALLDALLLSNAPAKKPELDDPSAGQEDGASLTGSSSKTSETYPHQSAALGVSGDGSKSMGQPLNNPSENIRHAGAFVRIDGATIPTDLAWLVQNQHLRATGVLALMAMAKQAKQRLSDVVAATKKYLVGLSGRELYAYLRALISNGRDYGHMLEQDRNAHRAEQERKRLAEKAVSLVGRQFLTRNGKVHVTVEKEGFLTEIRNGVRYCRHMDQAFLDALDDGRLIPVA